MKNTIMVIALLVAGALAANSQTPTTDTSKQPVMMHVISVHQATDREKSMHTSLNMQFYETRIGNLHYTLSDLTGWLGSNLEVGKDYEVVKTARDTVTILYPIHVKFTNRDKMVKGTFNITTVEEITPPVK